jgi:N-acetyl-gamma-glutamyl-phosphate reductase
MTKYAFLDKEPFFMPIVADYYRGMSTSVPVFGGPGLEKVYDTFVDYYKDEKQVTVVKAEEPRIYANEMAGSNAVKLFVYGNNERTLINVCFDNLGKGAAGAAVQNMNIMLGIEELKGLV